MIHSTQQLSGSALKNEYAAKDGHQNVMHHGKSFAVPVCWNGPIWSVQTFIFFRRWRPFGHQHYPTNLRNPGRAASLPYDLREQAVRLQECEKGICEPFGADAVEMILVTEDRLSVPERRARRRSGWTKYSEWIEKEDVVALQS